MPEELARELDEFGYRETDDPDEADRRRYYKVEKWDAESCASRRCCMPATTGLGRARCSPREEASAARVVTPAPEHPRAAALAARSGPQDRCEKLG